MRGWPANAAHVKQTVYGPPPLVASMVAAIDLNGFAKLAGHRLRGQTSGLRPQDQGSIVHRFAGDLGPLQQFGTGLPFLGTSNAIRDGFNTGLPNTAAIEGGSAPLLALLRAGQR